MIETNRLLITETTAQEIAQIIEMENHPDNRNYVWQGTYEAHMAEIEDPAHLLLSVKKKETGEMIGYVLAHIDFKSEVFELRRIVVAKKGKGYGRETMEAMMAYAFRERDINRFWLDVYPDNEVGIRLYESLGMHRDGVLRQNYKSERGYLDQIIYSVLKEEYFDRL